MRNALIGYTGFVGSNILNQYEFSDLYNSKNISKIDGNSFGLVVCSAARAEKWKINQDPESDLAEIDKLIKHLQEIKVETFVLISTVDVYKTPVDVDENTTIDLEDHHAYGKNRYYLEEFCRKNFDATIVRLPGLFGKGLKKNVIYDLLYNNNVDRIHHAGSFQYYNLDNIWKDVQIALNNNIKLINFATEPLRTDELAKKSFGIENFHNQPEGVKPGSYNMKTIHAGVYGRKGDYIYSKSEEIEDITNFVNKEMENIHG